MKETKLLTKLNLTGQEEFKKASIEEATENKYINTGRTTPPRNFQMRNIIKENPSMKPIENRFSTNNTIPEISSKYEESRDDTSIYNRSENSLAHNHPRSRSPFNVSHHQNASYVKENVEVRNSPRRVEPPAYNETVYYPNDSNDDVLQQKSNLYNIPPKIVRKESDVRISSPRVSNIERRSPRHSSPRLSTEGRISYQRDVTPTHMRQEQRVLEEYPEDIRAPRHPSPRERPMGSPRRGGKKRDTRTEVNILSRFLANKITGRKVEDMIFDIVYEVMEEAKNPRKKQVVEYQPPKRIKQREPSFDFERKSNQSHKEAVQTHNKELIQMIDRMEDEEGDLSETEDIDEKSRVNPITHTIEKKETKNHYVKRRVVDSLGIKFENTNKVNGVKSVPYQDSNNYPMIDVRSNLTRQKHEIWDVWWADWFDLIREGQEEIHLKKWRPFLTNKDLIESKAEFDVVELPYINEKIFKVSKAITQHLSEVLKTNAGIFDETVEIRFLRNLRQKAEDIEKNNRNIKALNQMVDSTNQICYDSKGNSELYWVFIFSKRLSKLADEKTELLDKMNRMKQNNQDDMENVRQTFIDKTSLRLTSIKDKMSNSINFDDVKEVLGSPYRKETRVDSRFTDLHFKRNNQTVKVIKNSASRGNLDL
jgi:hypothetical protein